MTRYSEELKQIIIAKMIPPENKSIGELSRKTGIGEASLHQWRKKARSKGFAVPAGGQTSERWNSQDKFLHTNSILWGRKHSVRRGHIANISQKVSNLPVMRASRISSLDLK